LGCAFSEIDFEKNALYVMEKVFNYGTWKDQVAIMKFLWLTTHKQRNYKRRIFTQARY
jgi:hypothetical protein